MLTIRKAGSLLAAALMLNTAFAQNESAVPAQPGDGPAPQAGQDGDFYRASELIGTAVRGDDGQELGKIQDLLIERRNQRIRYFLLGEGEELNAQSNLRVVPWTAARPQFEQDQRFVTLQVDQQRWQQAPSYTFQEIQTGPAGWTTEVDRFYGVTGRQGRGGRVDVERDGDVEIEGDRPRGRGVRGDRGEVEIEGDRPRGDVEIEGDRPRGRGARPGAGVEVERDGDVEIEGRGNRDRNVEGADVRVGPGGVQIEAEGDNN